VTRIRRILRIGAFVLLASLGILIVALAATQTRWFKDWLQRYVTREAARYLNGELLISRLDGNLFGGVQLQKIRLVQSGETVISADSVQVDYSLLNVIAHGLVIDDISVVRPVVRLRRDSRGWNVSRLVKEQAAEADREGPGRPLQIADIGIADGLVEIDDRTAANAQAPRLPRRLADLDFKGAFSYQPVNFTLEVGHLSFQGEKPSLALNSLSGVVSVRGDDVYFENVAARTADSSVQLKGLVRNYLGTPDANLRLTSDRLTLREFAAVVPQLEGVDLHPAFGLAVAGPLTTLRTDLDVRSEAGSLEGRVTADVMAPSQSVRGELRVSNFDASRTATQLPATRVNGHATFDLALKDDQTVRGTTRVSLENTAAAGYLVDRLDANVRLDGHRATVEASARAYGARATAKGDALLPMAGRSTLAYDLSGRADHVRADRLPRSLGVPRIASEVSATYRVRGAADRLTADATFDPSTVEGVVVQSGTSVHLEMAGRRLAYSARGAVDRVNPRRLGDALGVNGLRDERLDGSLDATFTLEGSGRTTDTLDAKADVVISNASFPVGRFSGVHVNATTGRGALDATVNGRFAGVNPGIATGRPNLDGSLSGTVDAMLSLPSMTVLSLESASGHVALALDPSRMAGQDVRHAQLDARLSNGVFDVRQLALDSAATTADASGQVALGATGESNLRYKITASDLAQLGKLAGVPDVAGAAVVEGTVSGNRDRLGTRGTLKLTNARYGTTAQALGTRTEFDVAVPSLDISQIDGTANTTATLVKAGGREIRDLTLDVRYDDQAISFNANVNETERRLEARGVANLATPGTIDLQLERLAAAGPTMAWTTPDGAIARIVYTPERLTVRDLRLSNGPQQIAASGIVDVKDVSAAAPNAPALATTSGVPATALTLTAQNVDLSQLDDLIVGDRGLAGKLDGKATVAGAMANPVADVDVTIGQGAAGDFKYERLTGRAHHDASGAKVDVRLDQSPNAWMTAEASLPNVQVLRDETARRNAPITAHIVTSDLDLGLVQMVTTAVKEVTGTARADLRAAGTIGAPQLSGDLTVQNGAFLIDGTETRLQGLDAAIRLHDDQIEIEKLHVLDENHHPLSATGTVAFAERRVGKVDVKVDAQDFKVMRSRLGELSIDVKGEVAGALPAVNVRGDVYVRAGRIEVDRVLEQFGESTYATESTPIEVSTAPIEPGRGPSTPAPVQQTAAAAPEPATPSLFDAVTLDAHLRVPNNLVLRGDDVRPTAGGYSVGDLNLTVGGDIRATKAAGDRPVVVGSIKTVRGFYEFQGRRFDLERDGTVSFKGPDPTDPTLDITGIREISGVEARVHVHGTAQDPRLDLKSVPPLDEADILSLIVFNRPVNELGEGEKTAVAQTAASMVGGVVAAPLAEALRDVLDVDLLEISVGGDSGTGPSVAIGNQLGERVFVRVRQQFGSADVTEFLLDYELTERLRLQTSAAEGAATNNTPGHRIEQAGVDLVFVKKY
jgi:autotransporter translocation and assembly factor TamB